MSRSDRHIPLELSESLGDLKNCALACQDYSSLARRFLFRDVTIRLQAIANDERRTLYQFLEFLASNTKVSTCIRDLFIGESHYRFMYQSVMNWAETSVKLAAILPGLTHLRYLKVWFPVHKKHTDGGMRETLLHFANIPSLQRLTLGIGNLTAERLAGLLWIPKLNLFNLDLPILNPRLTSLSGSNGIGLCDLTLEGPVQAEAAFSIARAAGKTLKRLRWMGRGEATGTIDLSALPSLTLLSISLLVKASNIKASLRQSNLISSQEWGILDAVLTSQSHPALEKVVISVVDGTFSFASTYIYVNRALSLFKGKLPMFQKKGIICSN
ncbi:hypothetical protein CPB84DRAFT_1772591 [Gymnopilus junonius]|uniref:Uncharacterized protein n=1 Tax=Gymnopilus junonius TaxID=109634 RepID=A0A9P5TQ48_GYMJU|nr:hypothetical protein CPB84DRAFT_1772591 [Gymnopilus junonius]